MKGCGRRRHAALFLADHWPDLAHGAVLRAAQHGKHGGPHTVRDLHGHVPPALEMRWQAPALLRNPGVQTCAVPLDFIALIDHLAGTDIANASQSVGMRC